MIFQRLEPPARLLVVADAAYKAKPDAQECLALRGYIIMLVGSNKTDSRFPGGVQCPGLCVKEVPAGDKEFICS